MKKIFLSLIVLAVACASCSVSQTAAMEKIRQIDNIQMSRTPISMFTSLPAVKKIVELVPFLKDLDSFDQISITENGAKNKARKLLDKFYKGDTYEMLMQNKSYKNQGVSIYALPATGGGYSDIIAIIDNVAEVKIYEIKGNFNKNSLNILDLEKLISKFL